MKRRQFLLTGALAGLASLQSASAQPKKQRAAVVIGVDKAGDLPKLRAAASGARQVEALLRKEGYDVVALVDDTDPVSVDAIFNAVRGFTSKGTYDQLVIFFAGHGVASEYVEYWLLSEAIRNPNQAVSLRESTQLARLYSGIPNVIFISDACRSTSGSLGVTGIKGGVIFPTAGSVRPSDIDQFMATLVGDPSFEVAVDDSTKNYVGIYTTTLLAAFAEANAEMVRDVNGVSVVPNKRLKKYLEREVPLRAQQVNIKLNQRPDAQVTSEDDVYIASVAKTLAAKTVDAVPSVTHLAAASLGDVGLRGLVLPAVVPNANKEKFGDAARELDASTGYSRSKSALSTQMEAFENFVEHGSAKLLSTGFYISGQPVESAYAIVDGAFRPFERVGDEAITAEVPQGRPASALIRFADGTSTMLAAIFGYVGNVVVARNGVINVSYLPRHGGYDRQHLNRLHAAVATAARFGVFRIEREEGGGKNAGAQLAGTVRMMKSVDPTLGLYAAYAYAEAGNQRDVESVRGFMRGDLHIDLFDTAMLSGALARKEATLRDTAPFCPMLAQGWALLRVNNAQLLKDVEAARNYLRPSLWTTFEPKGTDILLAAMRNGRLKA